MERKTAIFGKSELTSLVETKNSCVVLKPSVIDVYVLPYYLNDVVAGLWNALHSKLKKYDNKLEGILLGYKNIKVDLDAGRFSGRNAEIKYPVRCDCYVFQPMVGNRLEGTVNQISPGHIGCIVHQFFNATIKRPEDEDYDHWKNRPIEFNDIITFWVKDLDYTGPIPYIEGELEHPSCKLRRSGGEDSKVKNKSSKKGKKAIDSSLISSTQFGTKVNDNSDSSLFDFISPIPKAKKKKERHGKSEHKELTEEQALQSPKSPAGLMKVESNKEATETELFDKQENRPPHKIKSSKTPVSASESIKVVTLQKLKSPDFSVVAQLAGTPKKNSEEETNNVDDEEELRQRLLEEQINWLRADSPPSNPEPPKSVKRKLNDSSENRKKKKRKVDEDITGNSENLFTQVNGEKSGQVNVTITPKKFESNHSKIREETSYLNSSSQSKVSSKAVRGKKVSDKKFNKNVDKNSPAKHKVNETSCDTISLDHNPNKTTGEDEEGISKKKSKTNKRSTTPRVKKDPAFRKIAFYLEKLQGELKGKPEFLQTVKESLEG